MRVQGKRLLSRAIRKEGVLITEINECALLLQRLLVSFEGHFIDRRVGVKDHVRGRQTR